MAAYSHCWGASPVLRTFGKEVVEVADEFGVVNWSLVRLLSGLAYPVLRQSFRPWSLHLQASDGANDRCGNGSLISRIGMICKT